VTYSIEGDYFEACNCAVSCPCIFLGPATEDACDLLLAWRITDGARDGVPLDGLNVAMVVHTKKAMTDGDWTVALYLDERASADQGQALGAIFSGQAGGHLANLVPLIGSVAAVERAPVEFTSSNGNRSIRVGDAVQAEVEELLGMDGQNPSVITNPRLGAITQPLRQAMARTVRYDGAWKFEASGTNSFISEFKYEGNA